MHFPSLGSLPSLDPLIVVLIIVLVLFGGRGKISQVMGDFAKGIKSFKKGLSDDEKEDGETVKIIEVETESVAARSGHTPRKKLVVPLKANPAPEEWSKCLALTGLNSSSSLLS